MAAARAAVSSTAREVYRRACRIGVPRKLRSNWMLRSFTRPAASTPETDRTQMICRETRRRHLPNIAACIPGTRNLSGQKSAAGEQAHAPVFYGRLQGLSLLLAECR